MEKYKTIKGGNVKVDIVNGEVFGKRLRALREEQDLNQAQLANKLSEICKTKGKISVASVSCWERGVRIPRVNTLKGIAEFFGVSYEYLTGYDQLRGTFEGKDQKKREPFRVPVSHLPYYDGKPVYITFPNTAYPPEWGIYDAGTDIVTFRDKILKNTSQVNCVIYSQEPGAETALYPVRANDFRKYLHACTYANVKNYERVYVEINANSDYLKGVYNGWFKHNEDYTALIDDKGHTVEYNWIGDTFTVYYESEYENN